MSAYTPTGCDALPAYVPNNCDDVEMGRIRGVAYVPIHYVFTDPTNAAEWQTLIANGTVVVVPDTNGSYDGGKVKEGPGFGGNINTFLGFDHSAKFKDPNLSSGNIAFYDKLCTTRGYKLYFATEKSGWFADQPCAFMPSVPVQDAIDSQITFEIEAKWVSRNLPNMYTLPAGIFAV